MPAALRVIHPAPAAAVVAISAALGVILVGQAGIAYDVRLLLIVVSVAGSQVATGAINDWVDRERDARAGRRKPIPDRELDARLVAAIGIAGLVVQLTTSAALGLTTLGLAGAVSVSAQLYNVALSRTPLSVLPYLVSFGLLPAWIAVGVNVPFERVATATVLVIPFAAAAHLANALLDFDTDAAEGSRDLAQVLGRRTSRLIAGGLAMGVGVVVAAGFALATRGQPIGFALGAAGVVAVAQGLGTERRLWYGILLAAVLWTVAWALATG